MVDVLLMTMTGTHDTVFGLSKCVCFVSILTILYFSAPEMRSMLQKIFMKKLPSFALKTNSHIKPRCS